MPFKVSEKFETPELAVIEPLWDSPLISESQKAELMLAVNIAKATLSQAITGEMPPHSEDSLNISPKRFVDNHNGGIKHAKEEYERALQSFGIDTSDKAAKESIRKFGSYAAERYVGHRGSIAG